MKKEELTRIKILFLTSSHRFYFNSMLVFAIVWGIPLFCGVALGWKGDLSLPLFGTFGSIIIGVLCCLTYFIDILTLNIKTVEESKEAIKERSKKFPEMIFHAKKDVGAIRKVYLENGRVKKLIDYDKVWMNSEEGVKINPRYDYKIRWYYLGLSKVVVFAEYIPIGEKENYNTKKKHQRNIK